MMMSIANLEGTLGFRTYCLGLGLKGVDSVEKSVNMLEKKKYNHVRSQ